MHIKQNRVGEYASMFAFGFIAVTIVFLLQGVFWHDRSLLLNDCAESYYQIFAWLRQMLAGDRSPFFTFSFAGGTETLGMLVYYLMSPLNLLFFLISETHLQFGMHLVMILNGTLAFFTMYVLLRSEHPQRSIGILAAFSLSYALCDWYLGYVFNILWLDAMYLLPLVVLGLNRMVNGKRGWLYAISLALAVLSNYYIGFMICAFSLFYYIARVNGRISDKEERVSRWTKFWFVTIGAGLSTFVLMVPTLVTMTSSRMVKSYLVTFGLRGLKAYAKLFWGAGDPKVLNSTYCYLYSGVLVLVSSILYFMNRSIDRNQRKWNLYLMILLAASVLITPLYLLWHALSYPADFAGRFTFIIAFFSVLLACDEYEHLENSSVWDHVITIAAVGLFCAFYFLRRPDVLSSKSIIITFILAAVYIGILALPKRMKQAREGILIVLTVCELMANAFVVLSAFDKEVYSHLNNYPQDMREYVETGDTDGYYRTAVGSELSPMTGVQSGYNTSGMFMSSVTNEMPTIGYNLGYPQIFNAYWYSEDTSEIADFVLNHRYTAHQSERELYETVRTYTYDPSRFANETRETIKMVFQKNPYTFGIAAVVADEDVQPLAEYDSLDYQNRLMKALSGTEKDILINEKLTQSGETVYQYDADPDAEYYILVRLENIVRDFDIQIYQNDTLIRTYDPYEYLRLCTYIRLPRSSGQTQVRIEMNNTAVLKEAPKLYRFDQSAYQAAADAVIAHQAENVTVEDKGIIRMTATADDKQSVLFVSVPYAKGWDVTVDGEKSTYFNMDDGFIGIRIDQGTHDIEMVYHTPGFKAGAVMSLIGVVLLIIWAIGGKHIDQIIRKVYVSRQNQWALAAKICRILFVILVFGVLIIYPRNARYRLPLAVTLIAILVFIGWHERKNLASIGKGRHKHES